MLWYHVTMATVYCSMGYFSIHLYDLSLWYIFHLNIFLNVEAWWTLPITRESERERQWTIPITWWCNLIEIGASDTHTYARARPHARTQRGWGCIYKGTSGSNPWKVHLHSTLEWKWTSLTLFLSWSWSSPWLSIFGFPRCSRSDSPNNDWTKPDNIYKYTSMFCNMSFNKQHTKIFSKTNNIIYIIKLFTNILTTEDLRVRFIKIEMTCLFMELLASQIMKVKLYYDWL